MSPSPIQFLPIYMRGWNLSSSISTVMMILSLFITCNFYNGFVLSCCLISAIGRLTSDFELISDVIVVDTSYLSASCSSSLPTQLNLLICPLCVLVFGWETFARSCKKVAHTHIGRLCSIILGTPCLGSQDFAIFISQGVYPYYLGCVVWRVLPGWQGIQPLQQKIHNTPPLPLRARVIADVEGYYTYLVGLGPTRKT